MLQFYHMKGSGPCMKVHAFLEESLRPYQMQAVDLFKHAQSLPPLRDKNPLQKVPFIELDGFCLSESNAILRYLAQRWEMHDWYPANLETRARIDQWTDYVTQHIGDFIGILTWHRYFLPRLKQTPDPARIRFAENALLKTLPILDHYLQHRHYLVGHQPTLADLALLPHIGIAKRAEINLENYPGIHQWAETMFKRPAWETVRKFNDL